MKKFLKTGLGRWATTSDETSEKRQSGHRSKRDLATAGRWGSLLVAGRPHEFLGSRRTHESSLAATDWWLSEQTQIFMLCSRVHIKITNFML
ncbi:hypothetical protein QL285_013370 [Trifolium repens]|nr:hypothetical protein QL285_013370 [Trifolium repens]